jgi:hypothetical protein
MSSRRYILLATNVILSRVRFLSGMVEKDRRDFKCLVASRGDEFPVIKLDVLMPLRKKHLGDASLRAFIAKYGDGEYTSGGRSWGEAQLEWINSIPEWDVERICGESMEHEAQWECESAEFDKAYPGFVRLGP